MELRVYMIEQHLMGASEWWGRAVLILQHFLTAFSNTTRMLQHAISRNVSMYLRSAVEKDPTYELN